MSTRGEQCDVALLEYAYGELGPAEAQEVERHVAGCADCAGALAGMRGVRRVMGQLPEEAAPGAGLESLLAYAEQSARRAAAGPAPAPGGWRRWLAPVLGLGALATLAFVALPVAREVRVPLPSTVAADAVAPAAPAPARLAAQEKADVADLGAPAQTRPFRDELAALPQAYGDGAAARAPATKGKAEAWEGAEREFGAAAAPSPRRAATVAPPTSNVVAGASRDLGLRGGGGTGRARSGAGAAPAMMADEAPAQGLGALGAGPGGGGVGTDAPAPRIQAPDLRQAPDAAASEEAEQRPVRAKVATEDFYEAKKAAMPSAKVAAEARGAPAMPEALAVAKESSPELPFPSLRRAVADANGRAERQAALKRLCEAERAATPGRAPACDQLAREFPADGGVAR